MNDQALDRLRAAAIPGLVFEDGKVVEVPVARIDLYEVLCRGELFTEEDMKDLREELEEAYEECTSLENKCGRLEEELEEVRQEMDDLQGEMDAHLEELQEVKERLATVGE